MTKPGIVTALFLKPAKQAPIVSPETGVLATASGHGIEGDCNAHPLSPRQVLITRAEDLGPFSLKSGDLRENIVIQGVVAESYFRAIPRYLKPPAQNNIQSTVSSIPKETLFQVIFPIRVTN